MNFADHVSPSAAENIRRWLTDAQYAAYRPLVEQHIADQKWDVLNDVFWTIIPFGTGGRRGKRYPIGCNAINDRTIGESAQGLADYVRAALPGQQHACAIAYDTRHGSRHFAELCAGIMAAAGFQVYFLDGYRSTPALSFLVRYKKCSCGIMVTASHNPPSDNAVKVYWSTGGQILPPHDKSIIDRVMNVKEITQTPFAQAVAAGQVTFCQTEADAAFGRELAAQAFPGPRNLKIIYSPLHGVGESAVAPALAADGFSDVEVYAPHREPHADFPNVEGGIANPELPLVFRGMIERAKQVGADVALATDPDCDRLGVAAPVTRNVQGEWRTFTGNQIAVLLCDYVLSQRKQARSLSPQHYVVKTLVTTEMVRRIAESYGVETHGNLHVGFKYIGQEMDAAGPEKFVFGCEESHGYLVGQYARDKDGAVAAMLLAELAARTKAEGKSLHEKFDALCWQHGCHVERLLNVTMTGQTGMQRMKKLMQQFRAAPPRVLGGQTVKQVRDYESLTTFAPGGAPQPLASTAADMVIFDLAEPGNYVAVRPSGTEPKVKFYMFSCVAAEQLHNLETTRRDLDSRLDKIAAEMQQIAAGV